MTEQEMMKKWVETWKTTGPILKKMRRADRRKLDILKTIEALTFSADFSQEPFRPQPTSGLIEQQRLFMKWRDA